MGQGLRQPPPPKGDTLEGLPTPPTHRKAGFLLGGQRGCSQPPRGLLLPQSAPPPPTQEALTWRNLFANLLSVEPLQGKPQALLGPGGGGALRWGQLPQAWGLGSVWCLDTDPAKPAVRDVACELAWPGRKPQIQTMLGMTSGCRPGPHRPRDPSAAGSVVPRSPQHEAEALVGSPQRPAGLPACVGVLEGQWDTPEVPRAQPH